MFAGVEDSSYLCSAFRIRGNGRPTSERKEPTVSTAMCDERETGKRAALLLPLYFRRADFLFITMPILIRSSTKPPKLHIALCFLDFLFHMSAAIPLVTTGLSLALMMQKVGFAIVY